MAKQTASNPTLKSSDLGPNVYGSEVTEETVKKQPDYDPTKPITRQDVAKLALKMINDEGKRDKALAYLDDLAYDHASGQDAGTKCLIYNSTGATMTFYTNKDWSGHIVGSPYPVELKNGQWGVFFHLTTEELASSHGAVVYDLKDQYPNSDYWGVFGWFTGWGPAPNSCYAELPSSINGKYYKKFEDAMNESQTHHHISTHGNLQAELTIEDGYISIPEWKAIIKLMP